MGLLAPGYRRYPDHDRRGAGSTSGHPALSLFDFRDGPASDRVFPEPAHLRRRRRSGGIGACAALWVGGGKTCLAIICAVAPLGGIYYPISTLPDWL
jgi:hypothetical protein